MVEHAASWQVQPFEPTEREGPRTCNGMWVQRLVQVHLYKTLWFLWETMGPSSYEQWLIILYLWCYCKSHASLQMFQTRFPGRSLWNNMGTKLFLITLKHLHPASRLWGAFFAYLFLGETQLPRLIQVLQSILLINGCHEHLLQCGWYTCKKCWLD